jgi:hypothetical protein
LEKTTCSASYKVGFFMMIWFKPLPPAGMDMTGWTPFIQHSWFRKHFMAFVYVLMAGIFLAPGLWTGRSLFLVAAAAMQEQTGTSSAAVYMLLVLVIPLIFIVHEFLHIIVVYPVGDISLTFRGIFFWLNTDAVLSKSRFWLFMSLPLLTLSALPFLAAFGLSGWWRELVLYIGWVNLIISSSDLLNSVLIILKPQGSMFCRGCYRVG